MSASQTNAQQGVAREEKRVVLTDKVTGYPVAKQYVAPDGVIEIAIL
jgi:hypothetical protein